MNYRQMTIRFRELNGLIEAAVAEKATEEFVNKLKAEHTELRCKIEKYLKTPVVYESECQANWQQENKMFLLEYTKGHFVDGENLDTLDTVCASGFIFFKLKNNEQHFMVTKECEEFFLLDLKTLDANKRVIKRQSKMDEFIYFGG